MHVIVPNKACREVHKATYYIPTHVVKDTKTTSVNKETIPIYQTELSYVNLYVGWEVQGISTERDQCMERVFILI